MEEKQIFINGLKINYKIAGEGNPFLILHGWGGSSDSWIEVSKILAKKGFKVICPDFPGFGKSITPPVTWGTKEYTEFVLKFLEKINLGRINLLGHSFGGGIAVRFAISHPERLKKLILLAPGLIKHDLSFSQKFIQGLALLGNFLFAHQPLKRFKDVARNLFYIFLRSKDYTRAKGVMRGTLKKVLTERWPIEKSSLFLPRIKNKTLILWGKKDKAVPPEDAYLIKEKIPNSVLEIIPRASHNPNLEFPGKLATIILEFLKQRDPAS